MAFVSPLPPSEVVPDCEFVCQDVIQDSLLAEQYEREGDSGRATEIRKDIQQRTARCLGSVMCGERPECGILHGKVKQSLYF